MSERQLATPESDPIRPRAGRRRAGALVIFAVFSSGCQPKDLSFEFLGAASDSITGTIASAPSASSTPATPPCAGAKVSLHGLDAQGKKSEKITEAVVDGAGNFALGGLRKLGVELPTAPAETRYLIEVTCGPSLLRRYVTGNTDQVLDNGTTIMTWLSQSPASQQARSMTASGWTGFHRALESAPSITAAFSALNADPALKERFQSTFGVAPHVLNDAVPEIRSTSVPASFDEEASRPVSVQAVHWSATYEIAYAWKIGSATLASSANWSYAPSANSQGDKTLQLFVGRNDGTGGVDTTKPYTQQAFSISIADTVPAAAPNVSLVSPPVSPSLSALVRMTTGPIVDGVPHGCKSFSRLALVEDDFPSFSIPPLLPSSYGIDCAQAAHQDIPITLSGVEGKRTLRLWAMDSSGRISLTSKDAIVTLDRTNPVVSLTSLNGGGVIKGGSDAVISWAATELNPAANPIALAYSLDDGDSWAVIAPAVANTGSYVWPAPAANTPSARIRVTMTDRAGLSGSTISTDAFEIDSTPPDPPAIARTSAQHSKSTAIALSVSCDPDHAGIFLSSSASPPLPDDEGWRACAASMTGSVQPGDGTKIIYAYAKDAVGNVSLPGSAGMVLDQTGPSVSLGGFAAGPHKGGSQRTITWTAADDGSGLGPDPIALSYSVDGGGTWTTITASTANDGAEAWTIPAIDSDAMKIRVTAKDQAGNVSAAATDTAFSVDSTPPVVASTDINDGAAYAGTALLSIKADITDNASPAAQISIRLSNANIGTGSCQSEFADDKWLPYPGSAQGAGFSASPVDGTKKVCVWAKDQAGNVSVINPAQGTDGVDTDSINFQLGNPPEFASLSASRTSDGATIGIGSGQEMTILYSVSDTEGLSDNPISVAYTTDNSTWKDIVTGRDISKQSDMTWLGGASGNPKSAAGGITFWSAPTSGYFRIRAVAKDMSGGISMPAMSEVLNLPNWSVYAGSTDRGDGSTGKAAALFCDPYGAMFAVNPKSGDVYAADCAYGLRKLDSKTGIVSTVMKHGTNNLPDQGPLPAAPLFEIQTGANLHFDSHGRLYIARHITDDRREIYQIDFDGGQVRKYLGGGYATSGGSPPLTMGTAEGGFSFDEEDSLYFFTWCGGSPVNRNTSGKKIHKLTQNADGSPGTVIDVAGNCTRSALSVYGVPATGSTIGGFTYPSLSSIAAWNRGQTIYVATNNEKFKILNGIIHSANMPAPRRTAWLYYNASNGKLYSSNSTGGISITTPSLAGNGGEVTTPWFNGDSTAVGCNSDGASISNYCGAADIKAAAGNGQIFFSDGAVSNSASNYSIRFFDSQNKAQTLMGSLPLYGDEKHKGLLRGNITGIYYKNAAAPNKTAFPEGLYFMERSGVSFNYIHPVSGLTQTLWGSQNRLAATFSDGDVIGKSGSMGPAYAGGDGHSLMFDDTGLPWMRANYQLIKINASRQIEHKTTGSAYWHTLAEGADPTTARMYAYGTITNIALKGQTFFAIGGAHADVGSGTDPNVTIKALDFASLATTKIFGGTAKFSQSLEAVDDAPHAPTATMWYKCGSGRDCYSAYDANTDRLYFSEGTRVRYITTPTNAATAALVTLHAATGSSQISNLTVTPNGRQVWFHRGAGGLYCKDVSSGKSWCDGATNHFLPMYNIGFRATAGANQFTWKDDSTLFISGNNGIIYRFNLPNTP